ncbi:acyl-CoA thioesterase [candidate division KSB1 bacterium]|nr:acyl-CoA thioesterase [candidate division KSB1 bacterium]
MKRFSQRLKVRSYELDAQGHVNYAVYLNYLEYCRVLTLEQVGLPFEAFIAKGTFIIIAEVHAKYLAPAFLGDELDVTMEALTAGRTSMTFRQDVINVKSGKTIFTADIVAVFINKAGKPIAMDDEFRKVFD